MRLLHRCAIVLLIGCLYACSSGGLLQPPKSSGVIGMTLVGPETPLSQSKVLNITGGFAVQLFESNYNAQFTGTISSYTVPTSTSCYMVAMDTTGTVATFTQRTPVAAVCNLIGSDVETALFLDQQKHQITLSFTNIPASAPADSPAIVAQLYNTQTFLSSTLPATPVLNAFVLAVTESGYSGPFTGNIISYTAPTATSCYMVTMDATGRIATVAPRSPQTGPCISPSTDVEALQFTDSRGNASLPLFFQNSLAPSGAPVGTVVGLGAAGALGASFGTALNVDPASGTWPAGYGFVVAVSSPVSAGPFTGSIVSWTAATLGPCYSITNTPPNTLTFSPATPMPITAGTIPCSTNGLDTEGVLLTDGHGGYNEQFYLH